MESPDAIFSAHWDHEPVGTDSTPSLIFSAQGGTSQIRDGVESVPTRFMGSFNDSRIKHCDHEPPSPGWGRLRRALILMAPQIRGLNEVSPYLRFMGRASGPPAWLNF